MGVTLDRFSIDKNQHIVSILEIIDQLERKIIIHSDSLHDFVQIVYPSAERVRFFKTFKLELCLFISDI